jgi:hypothetical protein
MIPDARSRRAVEAAESWADGLLSKKQLLSAQVDARAAQDEYTMSPAARFGDAKGEALCAASNVALPNKAWVWTVANEMRGACRPANGLAQSAIAKAESVQVQLLRDIFGNPFRLADISSSLVSWNDGTVVKLGQAIYADRAFDRLPILADALEDAGCDNADILVHCRGPGPHVRGCWVVDLILGKA